MTQVIGNDDFKVMDFVICSTVIHYTYFNIVDPYRELTHSNLSVVRLRWRSHLLLSFTRRLVSAHIEVLLAIDRIYDYEVSSLVCSCRHAPEVTCKTS